jgi:hypothetical protein
MTSKTLAATTVKITEVTKKPTREVMAAVFDRYVKDTESRRLNSEGNDVPSKILTKDDFLNQFKIGTEEAKRIFQEYHLEQVDDEEPPPIDVRGYELEDSELPKMTRPDGQVLNEPLFKEGLRIFDPLRKSEDEGQVFNEESKTYVGALKSEAAKPVETDEVLTKDPPKVYKSWADDTDESDESDDLAEDLSAISLSGGRIERIVLPSDLASIWPRAHSVMTKVASSRNFEVAYERGTTLRGGGFKFGEFVNGDKETKARLFANMSDIDKINVSTFMSLIYFLRLRPTEVTVKESKYALTACYALHFLVLKDQKEENSIFLRKSLKHPDGGAQTIKERVRQCFETNYEASELILDACERLYRSNARSTNLENEDMQTIHKVCFTSPEGLLRSFMRTETRIEHKVEQQPTSKKGVMRNVKVEKRRHGIIVPNLPTKDDTYKLSERTQMKENESAFNDRVGLLRKLVDRYPSTDVTFTARVAKAIIDTSYEMLSEAVELRKARRRLIRIKAAEGLEANKKISPAKWAEKESQVVSEASIHDFSGLNASRLETLVLSKLRLK